MTRGMNMGKPLAPHPKDAITTPVLHYTSAVQRNDLYSHAVSTNHTQSSNEAMSLWDFQRPRTSEARARNKKHPNLRIKIPPRDAVSTPIQTDGTNGNTIGIALGSPRMIDRRNGIPQLRQQDPFAAPAEKPNRAPAIQRKPSKWRKIGGLFKAKNTMNPTASRPSYKVRNNNPPPGSSHSIDSQSHAEAGREPNSLSPGDDEKGNCFGGIRNCLEAKRKLKIDSKPRSKTAGQGASEPKGPDTVPFLEVDIPDTHLERYSVMFGGLFGQGKPALLARRSKTMDGMVSLNKESSKSPIEPPRQRRATSPTRSKSPSFTLFPTMQTSKASKILGTSNIPRGPSPLLRSQTIPTEQEKEHLLNNVNSPSLKSPMTPRSGFSPMPTPNASRSNLAQNTTTTGNGLGINIDIPPPHSPHGHGHGRHESATSSSSLLSPLSATKNRISSMLSPTPKPTNPPAPASASAPASRTESTLINTEEDTTTPKKNTHKQATTSIDSTSSTTEPFPNIEISVARSVSVSKGKKKQVVVPVGPGPGPKSDRLGPESEKKGKTPMVMDAQHGHRHGNSHDVRIESVE